MTVLLERLEEVLGFIDAKMASRLAKVLGRGLKTFANYAKTAPLD